MSQVNGNDGFLPKTLMGKFLCSTGNSSEQTQKKETKNSVWQTEQFQSGGSAAYESCDGRPVRSYEDMDGDGKIDHFGEYDDKGKLIKKLIDSNGDGTFDATYTYEYDDRGNKVRERLEVYSGPATRKIEYLHEYDDNGNRVKKSCDKDADAKIDKTNRYEYDDNGNVVKELIDEDADGTVDKVKIYIYNENGLACTLLDDNGDGHPDRIIPNDNGDAAPPKTSNGFGV